MSVRAGLLRRALAPLARGAASESAAAASVAPDGGGGAPLERFRSRLASGPDFSAFVAGSSLGGSHEAAGYAVPAPPLKARAAARAWLRASRRWRPACALSSSLRAPAGAARRASRSRSG